MKWIRLLLLLSVAAGIAAAQPIVAGVANAASNILSGLPNSNIGKGAIGVVYGSNLGPANVVIASTLPWPKVLGGTSATITSGGVDYDVPIYYALATQIAFLLPSAVPVGTAVLKVTYNGETSGGYSFTVGRNFGIFTLNSQGTGPGIITYADYTIVSNSKALDCGAPLTFCGAANPGQTLILWGTGLGPVTVEGDETTTPLPGDQPDIPLSVWVGGVSAQVVYRGRSGCCIAEDQIAFVVPDNVFGCQVPIAVRLGNGISNYATIAIAKSGTTCTPVVLGVDESVYAAVAAKGSPAVGSIEFDRSYPGKEDDAGAVFFRVNAPGTALFAAVDEQPLNTCTVTQYFNAFGPPGMGDNFDLLPITVLDAGPSLTISSGGRNRVLQKKEGGDFGDMVGDTTAGNYFDPGVYKVTGTGGADVGAFSVDITVPPPLVWSNVPAQGEAVMRVNGLPITWTGGDPKGTVGIHGEAWMRPVPDFNVPVRAGAAFDCRVSAAPGTFTVPPEVMLALPAQNPNNPALGTAFVWLHEFTGPLNLVAPGLDGGVATVNIEYEGVNVRLQ